MKNTPTETTGRTGGKIMSKVTQMPDGEFSMTRIMMIITFTLAALLVIIGTVASLVWKKELPTNLYNYTLGLAGGGMFQYLGTKVKDIMDQKKVPTATVPTATVPTA